jgi:predicted transcriptional regulator
MKIQPMQALIAEMRQVARGEIPAPADAAEASIESAEALMRLLTQDNRGLLRTIRDARPQSIAELARLTNRAEPNLLRTLGKLEAFGLLEIRAAGRRRVPTVTVETLHVEINPYAMTDRIETRRLPTGRSTAAGPD